MMVGYERTLWHHLRNRRLGGLKFRRKAPVGDVIADFLCVRARLALEVGGHAPGTDDKLHAAWLSVYRVGRADIERDLPSTLTRIYLIAEARLPDVIADPDPARMLQPPPTRFLPPGSTPALGAHRSRSR